MVRWIRTAISAMEVARRVSPVVVLVVVPLYALMGFGALGMLWVSRVWIFEPVQGARPRGVQVSDLTVPDLRLCG